jgi:hypothetical protein
VNSFPQQSGPSLQSLENDEVEEGHPSFIPKPASPHSSPKGASQHLSFGYQTGLIEDKTIIMDDVVL